MLCKGCGLEQKDNQMFCSHCGTRNEMAGGATGIKKCTNCGKDFYKEQRFCDACGGSLMDVHKETVIINEQEREPVLTEAQNITEPEPIVTETQKITEPEPFVAEALKTTEPEPIVTEALNTTEPEPIAAEALNTTEPEPIVTEAQKTTEPEPVVTKVQETAEQVPVTYPLPTPINQATPNTLPQRQAAPNPLSAPYPMQLPQGQMPTGQMPTGQMPTGQIQPGQMPQGQLPPRQLPPGQMPTGQIQPGQMPQGQLSPRQLPPGQMPPGQMPQGQLPPRQLPPGQIQTGQMQQGQMPQGQLPPRQLPPGQMPPLPTSSMPAQGSNGGKKKTLAVVIVAVAAVIILGVGVFGAIKLISFLKNGQVADSDTYTIDDYYNDIVDEYDEYSNSNDIKEDNVEENVEDIIEENPVDTTGENTDPSVDVDDLVTEPEVFTYDVKYTYTELPDAMSLDSDYRFTAIDYNVYDGVSSYKYWYNVQSPTLEDFHAAIDDYCVYLQSWDGYFYEDDLSLDQYQQTGSLTTYMSKNDMGMAVTAYTEADTYYVDVEIYNLAAPEENVNTDTYVNINYYLSGREFAAFDQYTEVFTESGIAFRVNDVSVSDLGNGYTSIDINMDLAATYDGLTSAYDDFLVLPMDSEGNILADASMIGYMYDINGYDTFPPFTLDTEYYDNYTVSFIVPSQTQYFTVYCTNLLDGATAGPAYYVDMEIY